MVRSYLNENRICYKSDGGSGGGDDGGSAAPAQTDARGRSLVRGTTNVIDASRQISPPAQPEPEPVNSPPRGTIRMINANGADLFDISQVPPQQPNNPPRGTISVINAGGQDLFDISQLPPTPVNQVYGMGYDAMDDAMLAKSAAERQARGPVLPAPVVAAPTPAYDSAEMARRLINQAAIDSYVAGGEDRGILDSVPGAAGRNDPESGFFADAYDELYGGTAPGTGIGALLGGLTNAPDPADAAAFNVGQLEALGGVRDPQTGAITGARAGPGTLNMNRFGMVTYSGLPDPNYTGAFQNLVRGNTGTMSSEDTDDGGQMAQQMAPEPVDPGTTTPEQIDDLAINYLRNPFFLYGGAGNLFQPYGYAPGTMVDLLQTRNMTMPDQAAPNLNLFGNPRDFT
jgi:hypothetical protein